MVLPISVSPGRKSWFNRFFSYVEPILLHQGVSYTFVFIYTILNIITFFVGACPAWNLLAEDKFAMRAATALARASGAMLNLNAAFIILVASRTLMTALRQTILNMFVPFDKAMPAFHSLIGNFLFVATCLHTVAHLVRYSIRNLWKPGLFGTTSLFVSGCLLTTIVIAMRITSLVRVRKKSFECFYWVHYISFLCFYILIIFHGTHKGDMKTWMYVSLPLIIYLIDRALRLATEQGSQLTITRESAVIKGSDMVCLRIPRIFSYLAGQYCDIKVPQVSNLEWHPFTIASSPHENEMLFYIKVNGDWTRKLYSLFQRSSNSDDLHIHVRGPYGAPAQHVGQYEHIVLVSGGVGATPFCSIAKYAHHWILNFTRRGIAASNSVSAAFTRNQSAQGTPSTSGTHTLHASSGYLSARQSRTPSRPTSRNQSMNMSSILPRNFSRNASTSSSRILASRPITHSSSGRSDKYNQDRSSLSTRSVTRSTSYNGDRITPSQSRGQGFHSESRSGSVHSDKFRNDRLDKAGTIKTNYSGTRNQEPRENRTLGSQPEASESCTPTESLAAGRTVSVNTAKPDSDVTVLPESLNDETRLPYHTESGSNIEEMEFGLPDDYDEELGNPDLPIPDRRAVDSSPSVSANQQAMFEVLKEYPSSQVVFDEDEEHVAEEEPTDVSKSGLVGGGVLEEWALEGEGLELEDEILQEHTASNAYNMLGISFGQSALARHMAEDGKKMLPSFVRTSLNLMDDAMDAALWRDRALFYLHTVTVNWVLLWLMLVRFALVFVGLTADLFTFSQPGLGVFKTHAMNAVDLFLAIVISIPLVGVVVMEVYVSHLQTFLANGIANSFDLFLMVPLLFLSTMLHILNLVGVGKRVDHISKLTVCLIWPVLTFLILWRIARTIGSRVVLAPRLKSTLAQTKALDYIWVSKTHEDDTWLIEELLPLAESNVIRLHRFITRHGPKTEPWMLEYEKIPLKTTYSRPDWDEVFGNLVERARSGTTIGVFFCGPDSMAQMIQQAALKAMAKSMENAYQRGYFAKKTGKGIARTESNVVANTAWKSMGGAGPIQGRIVNGNLDRHRAELGRAAITEHGVQQTQKVSTAYGCSVRITIRVENFT